MSLTLYNKLHSFGHTMEGVSTKLCTKLSLDDLCNLETGIRQKLLKKAKSGENVDSHILNQLLSQTFLVRSIMSSKQQNQHIAERKQSSREDYMKRFRDRCGPGVQRRKFASDEVSGTGVYRNTQGSLGESDEISKRMKRRYRHVQSSPYKIYAIFSEPENKH